MFHQGPTPQRWLHHLTASLSERLGADVSIGSVTLAGFDRIALHDVTVAGDGPMDARRVVAAFSLGEFLRNPGDPAAALRWVRVEDWRAELFVDEWPGSEWTAMLVKAFGFPTAAPAAAEDGLPAPAERETGGEKSSPGAAFEQRLASLLEPFVKGDWVDGDLKVYVGEGRIALANRIAARVGEEGSAMVGAAEGASYVPDVSLTAEGTLVFGGGRFSVRGVAFGVDGSRITAGTMPWDGLQLSVNGTVWPRPDLYVRAVAEGSRGEGAAHRATDRPATDRLFRYAEGEAWLAGTWQKLDAWGTLRARDAVLPWWSHETPYTVDEAVVHWGRRPSEPIQMAVDAARGAARLHMKGTVSDGGLLDFVVAAADVAVPKDVPPLAGQEVQGNVDFNGMLQGSWAEPVLAGEALADGGYLFGQPLTELQGNIRLSRSEFAFQAVRATQGNSDYYLEGELGFAETMPFELVLRTDRGRTETLLAVLNWDVPVQAGLRGTMRFERRHGPLEAEGQIALERGSAWGQPFDRAEGDFRYEDGRFVLSNGVGSLRGGTVTGFGGSDGDGWTLHVKAEDVPLQAIIPWREALPGATGVFDFVGEVQHGAGEESPGLRGDVTARHVHVGLLDFAEGEGVVALDGRELVVEGLRLRRDTGGVYDVVGKVEDVFAEPRLALDVDVRGESVEALVAMTDWRLPLLARSEPMRARIAFTGPAASPEAAIRVESDAVYVLGRSTPLAMDLRWRDGRIEIERDADGAGERG